MRPTAISTLALTVALLAAPAGAQNDRPIRGPRAQDAPWMEPEQVEAAWRLQATGVARSLELTEHHTAKLITAYQDARKRHRTAVDEMRKQRRDQAPGRGGDAAGDRPGRGLGGDADRDRPGRGRGAADGRGQGRGPDRRGGGGGALQEAQRELAAAEREKLAADLGSFLSGEALARAKDALGTFDPAWDRMVHVIAGFEMDETKTFAALVPIQAYVATIAKTRASDDRWSMRETMRDARRDLASGMEAVLDDDQMQRFQAAMRGPRGDRRGRGGAGLAERLKELDANGDGKIARSETPDRMAPLFDRLDANGDDFIDEDEIENARGRGRNARRDPIF